MPRRKLIAKKRSHKAGLPPGSLVHIGEKRAEKARITLIRYNETQHEERSVTLREAAAAREAGTVSWINIDGLHQVELLEEVGTLFGIHPLVQEDILNTDHRPKLEDYDDYLFIVLKMLFYDEQAEAIRTEQISLVLGSDYVLSFQEEPGDVFDGIRERLRINKGRLRKLGADYLAYAIIDAIVDGYFGILETIGDHIEEMEEELVSDLSPATLQQIHSFKREMIMLRKSVWPLREVLSNLRRQDSALIRESTDIFLRDVYDHTIQVVDTVETFRDVISGMLDLYLSSVSNRMNEVMKVLTIIATIFIPLTFLAGIYGMNFTYIPELKWHWGYFALWGVMLAIAAVMLVFFHRKRWL
ncbi:MAG TPA: magnesium/cobalt transporter CorA [Desulfuromonadales bacterium]|nr:magnesium/cobalt transporter CorA [Desulfuromonadales bacterium]